MRTLFLLLACFAGLFSPAQDMNWKAFEKSLVPLDDGKFISAFEVDNQMYRAFLADLQARGETEKLAIAMWDTTQWATELAYSEPYKNYYHSHPAYDRYPAVNMSQAAAVLFCEWLTQRYNAQPKRKYPGAVFRLPEEKEWVSAVLKGGQMQSDGDGNPLNYPASIWTLREGSGAYMANFRTSFPTQVKIDPETGETEYFTLAEISLPSGGRASTNHGLQDAITAPVNSFRPNGLGIYNLLGNVAEWVQEEGVTKGGAWNTTGWYLLPHNRLEVEGGQPRSYVGFRVIMLH
jgi:formylglycine-generating enzyme required for sulfatase activity